MHTIKCTKPGCERSFTKRRLDLAVSAARMHTQRVHGTMKVPGQSANGNANGSAEPKRPYTRKQPITASVAVNFCPQCGCNIHKVAVGMVLSDRIK